MSKKVKNIVLATAFILLILIIVLFLLNILSDLNLFPKINFIVKLNYIIAISTILLLLVIYLQLELLEKQTKYIDKDLEFKLQIDFENQILKGETGFTILTYNPSTSINGISSMELYLNNKNLTLLCKSEIQDNYGVVKTISIPPGETRDLFCLFLFPEKILPEKFDEQKMILTIIDFREKKKYIEVPEPLLKYFLKNQK